MESSLGRAARSRMLLCVLAAVVLLLAAGCSSSSSPGAHASTAATSSEAKAQVSAVPSVSDASTTAEPLVLVVDGSGSMVAKDAGKGLSRIAAARKAATALVAAQPPAVPIGLVTYGTHSSSAQTAAAKTTGCKDISVLAAPTAKDHDAVTSQISQIDASGYTPIGAALTKAVGTLGSGPGRVVLVSDGVDTCTPPDPCATAKQLVAAHQGLTISTVGFKTKSAAGKQLSCIAAAGHGVFVTADDTSSLVRRLGATSDATKAREMATSTGLGSAQIGQSLDQLRSAIAGFPAWSSGKRFTGSLPGLTGRSKVITVIVWRDCSYYFDSSRKLVGIDPGGNGTIDGIKPGSSPAAAKAVYGAPLSTVQNKNGTYSALYQADSAAKTKYWVVYDGNPSAGGTIIKIIYLCTCERPAAYPQDPTQWVVDPTTGAYGPLQVGMSVQEARTALAGNPYVEFGDEQVNPGMSLETVRVRAAYAKGAGATAALAYFDIEGARGIGLIFCLTGATVDGLHAGDSLSAFHQKFGARYVRDNQWTVPIIRTQNGAQIQLSNMYQISGSNVAQPFVIEPSGADPFAEFS